MSGREPRQARIRAAHDASQKIAALVHAEGSEVAYNTAVAVAKKNAQAGRSILNDAMSCYPDIDVEGQHAICKLESLWLLENHEGEVREKPVQVQKKINLGCSRLSCPIEATTVGAEHRVDIIPELLNSSSETFEEKIAAACQELTGSNETKVPIRTLRSLSYWLKHDNHTAMLTRAWCDILSKTWVEWVDGVWKEPCALASVF